ncbi:hypothetical protein AMS64_12215 [Aeromonas veronii]|uniref:hypothetical protein n=1 Tax=Aeromonas veronii TaxID=654 RepID=UPI00078B7E17|nr:hypothetical protein [Aeromonas veronii]AMQ43072.1 hypothetical protein AMS64_12215 [Aeromonas veronii]
MSKHTKEPWNAVEVDNDSDTFVKVCHANGGTIAKLWIDVDDREFSDEQRENARRIVACVNACRNLSNDELEQKGLVTSISARFLAAERSRDELLEALEEVHRIASGSNITHNMMVIRDHCADAIAKAKGGAS